MKKGFKKGLAVVTCLAAILTTMLIPNGVGAYGPSTMYTSSSGAPAPGTLYPRAMQASTGKMYATFEQYSNSLPVFPIYESSDYGQSWTKVGNVSDTQHGWGLRWEPQLYELPQAIGSLSKGTLLCAGMAVPSDRSRMSMDLYKSTDAGRTWSFVSTIATGKSANPGSDPVWEPFLLVANNKLICYYSDERDSGHGQKLVHQTTTNGTSWSAVVDDVALADSSQRPGMPVVAKMPNGNYIMTYEIMGKGGAWYQTSSNPESWNVTSSGTCFDSGGSGPYCVTLNGTVILSSGGNNNLYTNSNNASGSWTQISCVVGACYSRCLVPLSNGRLFAMNAGWNGSGLNRVTYGDMAVATSPASYARLRNVATGLYIDGMGSTTNGSNACQYTGNSSSTNQQWTIVTSGSYVMIKNRATGLYLDGMGSTSSGSVCGQWASSSSNNQQWTKESSGNYVKFKNRTTGLYLDGMGSTANGSNLCQRSGSSSTTQQWQVQ